MFWYIPGTNDWAIDEEHILRSPEGKLIRPSVNQRVRLTLYGKPTATSLKRLFLLAHHDMFLPDRSLEGLQNVKFVPQEKSGFTESSGFMPIFKEPIHINKDFRVCPLCPSLAVNKEGTKIYCWRTDKYLNVYSLAGYRYLTHYGRNYRVHRLVASAWVENPNPRTKPVVNHIDHNRDNPHYLNLEWCTQQENAEAMVEYGNSATAIECKVRDFVTGVVTIYPSVNAVAKALGLKPPIHLSTLMSTNPYRLYMDRYEIKPLMDQTPWKKISPGESRKSQYTFAVYESPGNALIYHDRMQVQKNYKIWNVPNIERLIDKFSELHPDKRIYYCKNYIHETIQSMRIGTWEIKEWASIREASRKLNVSFSAIHGVIRDNASSREVKGYLFRTTSSLPWERNVDAFKSKKMSLKAVHEKDGSTINFVSLRAAATHFNCDRSTVKRWIRKKIVLFGYFLNKS